MSFKEIIGQELPIKILKNLLKEKRLGRSFLFYGPLSVGKFFTAKQFAKSLNCESNLGDDSCDNCITCRSSDNLQYPDLHCLDLSNDSDSIKIEQIRSMQNDINLRPYSSNFKVFIINNCQVLTPEAANCLLKVLEEPPSDSVIILITPSLRSLLPTIVSRCQKVKFSSLRRQEVGEFLQRVYKLDKLSSHYLAYYLDGRIGEAISLSKQDFLKDKNIILDKFIHNTNPKEAEELFQDKAQGRKTLSILIAWFRDLMYIKMKLAEEQLINQDRITEIRKEASRYSYRDVISAFNLLTKSFWYLERNINTKLLADNLKARIWKN